MRERTTSRHESVRVDIPVIAGPILRDTLDEVPVGSSHSDPERKDSIVVAWGAGEDKRGPRLADEGIVGRWTSAERGAHGGIRFGNDGCGRESR